MPVRSDAMKALLPLIPVALLLPACDGLDNRFAPAKEAAADYRPHEAGTVDHALCLLGFVNVPVLGVNPGHHLVTAQINGISGDFVLDTGANVTVVNAPQAERFGLSSRGGSLFGTGAARFAGNAANARTASVDSFTMGDVTIRQRRVLVADLGPLLDSLGQASGREIAGLIGQDVLNEHRAIIDMSRPMLHLMAEDRDPVPVPAERCTQPE